MDTTSLIRGQLKTAHDWFEGTIEGVSQEQAAVQPQGTAHSIGSRYAHAVVAEDVMVNAMLKRRAPLYGDAYRDKTGISEPRMDASLEWARNVQVDLDAARRYAQAVYANSDEYLATLTDDDLNRTIDMSAQNMGEWPLGAFLITFVIGHIRDVMGEISALKGTQGLKGYPF